jgi:predicted peroxiredoxin
MVTRPRRRSRVQILYIATSGADDATRASIPLHLAANGSVEADQDAVVALIGDAAELVIGDTAERMEGVGIPPVRELLRKLRDHEVPVYV